MSTPTATRPTPEQVDAALRDVATSGRYAYANGYAGILAAEVRALRAEVAELRDTLVSARFAPGPTSGGLTKPTE